MNFPLHFDPILYPVWRRQMPTPLKRALMPVFRRWLAADADLTPPTSAQAMAGWLRRWKLLDGTPNEIAAQLGALTPVTAALSQADPAPYDGAPLRLPAQWEPAERVLLRWGVVYPWAWPMFAQIVHALLPVVKVEVVVPSQWWARAVLAYLQLTDGAPHVCFLITPTDDIWIRDYGPLSGRTTDGQPVLVDMIYRPLPRYPQTADDGFNRRYAAHHRLPLAHLPLHFEGGNLWSDGQGTLITTDHALSANRRNGQRALTPDELLSALRRVLAVEKLLITPRMRLEETGHVDLVAKLADATTVLVTAPDRLSAANLKAAEQTFRQQTNARGQRYDVRLLPTPPLYLNWFVYPIRRGYTNALTVNGRVLVPTYGLPSDDVALRVYADAMPQHTVIPIDSRIGINGGGAVHCMTREIFA